MASAKIVKADLAPLKAMVTKSRELASTHIKVGVLAKDTVRKGEPETNATLGMVHELGSKSHNIPVRSWLRTPLMMKLPDRIAEVGKGAFEAMAKGDILAPMDKLGTQAVAVIDEAFNTEGFGTWPQWSARYARSRELGFRKTHGKKTFIGPVAPGTILVRSAQLAKSVSFEVVGGSA
jgi:hypothetical protein